ncbi:S1 RNA-binding domain-containing protein [Lentibacillus sp. N15]|uniref:S1 RNA-binding domain-containing protein n=1 Tax=Lentibacillus songyuanensis TaxID=3136161 RepID=UPI0031BB6557
MSHEIGSMLIEGFNPEKLEGENLHYDKTWKEIYGAYQNKTILQAPIVAIEDLTRADDKKETCAVIQIDMVRGFIPLEQMGVDNKRQLRAMTGKKVAFKVLSYDRENDIFVGSRTAALEQMATITLNRIEEGDTIVAVVSNVSPNLIRADIGGIEVKIPIDDVRYGWIDDLTEEIKAGDHFHVKVMEIDAEEKKVKVSAKATQKNPYPDCLKRYKRNSEYVGVVSGVREYGVFVNLEDGVDSLARHLIHENVAKGDRVLVRIINTDAKKEHIVTRITRVI